MVASIEGTLVPSFALELVRVAVKALIRMKARESGVVSLQAGGFATPTEADGMLRLYYSPRRPRRFVPAIDVLQGRADLERLAGKIVIVGLTGVMQVDHQETPLGERLPASKSMHRSRELLRRVVDHAPALGAHARDRAVRRARPPC
jgi:adenylate cyclase